MSFNFAPKAWAQCNGQLLPINQNQALFSLLGTNFGGDGRTNFALPDLRGRTPLHVGSGQLWPIIQSQALSSLLGTNFGGDGRTNFALPDLRGRTPIHVGNGHLLS